MAEEPASVPAERQERAAWREARLREARLWRGGLIAAIVLLALATLYNGAAYRRLARSQEMLAMSVARQSQPPFGPMGHPGPMWPQPGFQGYGGPPPFAAPWAHEHGGCGCRHHHEEEEEEAPPAAPGRQPGLGGKAAPPPKG